MKVSRQQQIRTLKKAIKNEWYPDKLFKQHCLLNRLIMEEQYATVMKGNKSVNGEINMIKSLPQLEIKDEENKFLSIVGDTFDEYLNSGARSNKKTLVLHTGLKNLIQVQLPGYNVVIEENVKSINSSGKKSCDIVAYKDGVPSIIFPVKNIMTNYYQNKNNSWENLTGEIVHLKKANEDIHIIPINIIFNSIPYCERSKQIKHFESIEYKKTYKITENLVKWGFASDIINYIIDVNHLCCVKGIYDKCPEIIGFSSETPYRNLQDIFSPIIQ